MAIRSKRHRRRKDKDKPSPNGPWVHDEPCCMLVGCDSSPSSFLSLLWPSRHMLFCCFPILLQSPFQLALSIINYLFSPISLLTSLLTTQHLIWPLKPTSPFTHIPAPTHSTITIWKFEYTTWLRTNANKIHHDYFRVGKKVLACRIIASWSKLNFVYPITENPKRAAVETEIHSSIHTSRGTLGNSNWYCVMSLVFCFRLNRSSMRSQNG